MAMLVRGGPSPEAPHARQPALSCELISPAGAGRDFLCFLAQCLTDTRVDTWRVVLAWQAKAPARPATSLCWAPDASPGSLTCRVCVTLAKSLLLSKVQ